MAPRSPARSLAAALLGALLAGSAGAQGGFVFAESLPLAPGYALAAADFYGDARAELFAYDPATGTLFVGENLGAFFSLSPWATVSPASGWQFEPGDFDGDGATDVLGFFGGNGTLWVGRNTGASFAFDLWLAAPAGSSADLTVGDFDGDGLDDFMADLGGPLLVALSDGSSHFEIQGFWANVVPETGWLFVANGFMQNGVSHLGAYHPSNGTLWVGISNGAGFTFLDPWGELQSGGWLATRLASGDVDGDGDPDLVAYDPARGEVVAGLHAGSSTVFVPTLWAAGVPGTFSSFVVGDFAGSPALDAVGYDAGTGALWVGESVPTCSNGRDDDGDGLADAADPGCADGADPSEWDATKPCDDGLDNDGDGLVDEGEDPGCFSLAEGPEDPQCDDGLDNDGDGTVDLADAQCTQPFRAREGAGCGLGAELALALAALRGARRRRGRG